MAVAALTMYAPPTAVSNAYQELAREVAQRLGIPLESPPPDLPTLWHHPQLLLAQTCGYPYVTELRPTVKLVAAPRYTLPGCEGATHCSFILVPASSAATTLADLRGKRVAMNSPDSNSGMNLLRLAVAPLAKQGRFFSQVVESGSHAESMARLKQGRADVAAVDAVTFGYLRRDLPELVEGLRILQRTRQSPTLPLITAAGRTEQEVEGLREALAKTLAERPDLAEILAIQGFDAVDEGTYLPILDWEHQAIEQNYPTIG
ncbi:uncharacterized protein HMPREF1541_10332 [Cyphellophora europaea CBS 101466]|uniref:Phosphate/phosphite/phosphonate ABC transporter, periplasmic binding protein n=1 Tax=Cyphellophora europaea (strain CBS 101466) TaxID=1220924 RepID=W2S7K0_CYPE1|nr:uncharacterized protein HMPREF1541_10332 [Cyphellophora europaea CBS 101466]ETN44662.1 hypothetical protein HMPREF1541_10332 [Cyphellophora europaea CBS 101466]